VDKKYVIKKKKKKIKRAENLDELADKVLNMEERREKAKELYRDNDFKMAELQEFKNWAIKQINLLMEVTNAGKEN
jgi:hypothetical protein|tara:strand:- start:4498 stop:4725 length:228 start_codon:yes stop_codon:yes gene_type:complete